MNMSPGVIAYLVWFVMMPVTLVVAAIGKHASRRILILVGSMLCWAFVAALIGYLELGGIDYLLSTAGISTLIIGTLGLIGFGMGTVLALCTVHT